MPKYYSKTSKGSFRVTKWVDGKQCYFGIYKTEEEAQKRVEFLKKENWDSKYIKERIRCNNIQQIGNNYHIHKNNKYYGSYPTREEAEKAVEFFKEHDWDSEYIKYKTDKSNYVGKYISLNPFGNYYIRKMVDGELQCFGTFRTLEQAKEERDRCVKYDWDIDRICECE